MRRYRNGPTGSRRGSVEQTDGWQFQIDGDSCGLETGVVRLIDPRWVAGALRRRTAANTRPLWPADGETRTRRRTSIPGMCAKPVLDVAAGVPRGTAIQGSVAALERAVMSTAASAACRVRRVLSPGPASVVRVHWLKQTVLYGETMLLFATISGPTPRRSPVRRSEARPRRALLRDREAYMKRSRCTSRNPPAGKSANDLERG